MDFPLFDLDWTAAEDILLLKGISSSGIDNWHQISDQLSLKTPEDCEAHFYSFYYKSQEDPIPRIEEIGVLKRDKNNKPILKDDILEANNAKKEKFLEEIQKKRKPERDSKGRYSKNDDDNSDDNSKKQGKFALEPSIDQVPIIML